MKVKPLLSCEVPLDKVNFPIYISTKYDGVRALVIDGVVMSRSLKPIRNKHVQKLFGKPEYNGFDGELIVGDIYAKDVFQKTTSGVMSAEGEPDVTFYVFDIWDKPELTYVERQALLLGRLFETGLIANPSRYAHTEPLPVGGNSFLQYIQPKYCESASELEALLEVERNLGGEGLIGRVPDGKYKYGRSTPKEQLSIKFKFFVRDEFELVGFTERMHNTNEQTRDALGYAERSSAKDGLVPMNTLGSLILKYGDTTFLCGTGFDDALRKEIWLNKDKYLGKLASIRYMSVGAKDLPRLPSFQGFRDEDDL